MILHASDSSKLDGSFSSLSSEEMSSSSSSSEQQSELQIVVPSESFTCSEKEYSTISPSCSSILRINVS